MQARWRCLHRRGNVQVDPLISADPWRPAHLELSPEIVEAKQRLIAMRSSLTEVPAFPSAGGGQQTNADLISKLDRMMGVMALKEHVQVAQMEVIKQMRSELTAQIEPIRLQIDSASANAMQAREETKSLHERFAPVTTNVNELMQNHAILFERIGHLESQAAGANVQGLERLHLKMLNAGDLAFQRIAISGFKCGTAEQRFCGCRFRR